MSFHESPFDQGRWVGEDVQVGAYIFQFREEPYEFYREKLLKCQEVDLATQVDAVDKAGNIVARYANTWETSGKMTVEIFMDRFCWDTEFRAQYQVEGPVIEDALAKPDGMVHPKCAAKIAELNEESPKHTAPWEYAELITYGRDEVSRMKWNDLKDLVSTRKRNQLVKFMGEKATLEVLRWIKRGLDPEHAVQKVQYSQRFNRRRW